MKLPELENAEFLSRQAQTGITEYLQKFVEEHMADWNEQDKIAWSVYTAKEFCMVCHEQFARMHPLPGTFAIGILMGSCKALTDKLIKEGPQND